MHQIPSPPFKPPTVLDNWWKASLYGSLDLGFEASEKLDSGNMNLFIQSVPNWSSELVHQTEGSRYFKDQVIKNNHTKISEPVQPTKLAHQVKLGYPWKGRKNWSYTTACGSPPTDSSDLDYKVSSTLTVSPLWCSNGCGELLGNVTGWGGIFCKWSYDWDAINELGKL